MGICGVSQKEGDKKHVLLGLWDLELATLLGLAGIN